MEKPIRNARKAGKITRRVARPLPSLSEKQGGSRKTLWTLPGTPQGRKQTSQEIIREALDLVIPCRVDKPDRIKPIFLVVENALGGGESAVWQCEQCTMIFHSHNAWKRHAGLVPNLGSSCKEGAGKKR